jgi:hypothetical protein
LGSILGTKVQAGLRDLIRSRFEISSPAAAGAPV